MLCREHLADRSYHTTTAPPVPVQCFCLISLGVWGDVKQISLQQTPSCFTGVIKTPKCNYSLSIGVWSVLWLSWSRFVDVDVTWWGGITGSMPSQSRRRGIDISNERNKNRQSSSSSSDGVLSVSSLRDWREVVQHDAMRCHGLSNQLQVSMIMDGFEKHKRWKMRLKVNESSPRAITCRRQDVRWNVRMKFFQRG